MAISKRNYNYTVVEGDSLKIIATTHGLLPAETWARKIWEDSHNSGMYSSAIMLGNQVQRKLHKGNNKYEKYEHSKWAPGYRGYDDPHQIILYSGEKIWIPPEEEVATPQEQVDEETVVEEQDTEETVAEGRGHDEPEKQIEVIFHELTDDELINGFVANQCKKYILKYPVFKVRMETKYINEDDKFILTGKMDDKIKYKTDLTVSSDKIENGDYIDLHFFGPPRNLLYTLTVDPGVDAEGKKSDPYIVMENEPY